MQLVGRSDWIHRWGSHGPPQPSFAKGTLTVDKPRWDDLQAATADLMKMVVVWLRAHSDTLLLFFQKSRTAGECGFYRELGARECYGTEWLFVDTVALHEAKCSNWRGLCFRGNSEASGFGCSGRSCFLYWRTATMKSKKLFSLLGE